MYTRLMALGRLRRGFFASPAAIYKQPFVSVGQELATEITYSNNLSTNEGESGLRQDSDPAKELALRTTDVIELGEGTRVLPVTEADPIMVGATTKIKDDTEDDQSGDSDNLDGPVKKR